MFGFEVTIDDVAVVLMNNKDRITADIKDPWDLAESIEDDLDMMEFADAAMECTDDLDEQTNVAHAAIERELVRMGVLS